MINPCVLIAGPNISSDAILIQQLGDDVTLLKTEDYSATISITEKRQIDLLLLEDSETLDISLIGKVKKVNSNLQIIIINGRDVAGAFAHGAIDAFPEPYDRHLLVERVHALLRRIPDI